ncbi:MAG: tape measure protein, partial [Tannerella sp.]|nr:tape measure protein [Tannerella sp.]
MNEDGKILYALGLDLKSFRADVDRAMQGFRDIGKSSSEVSSIVDSAVRNIGGKIAAIFTLDKAAEFVGQVAKVRGEFQQLEVAFETMLGSREKADAMMAQIVKTAATTPFDLQGVAQGAKQLLAFGESSETVNDTLIKLGNIASGLSLPLNDLVYLYGTTMVQGRLFSNDVRQFMGRGIPLVQELSKAFGKTQEEINEMVTAGKIGFPEVQKVINNLTSEGGMFYNLMEKQSKTVSGQIANLGDAWDSMLNSIGKSNEGVIGSAISGATLLVENYEKVGEAIAVLIGLYGTYKAAIIASAAIQNVTTAASYDAEIAALSKLLPVKEASANADVQAAVMSGRLTESKAAVIIAIRKEIAVRLEGLKTAAAEATAEATRAATAYRAALNRSITAKGLVVQRQLELSQINAITNAEAYEAAQKSLLAAQEELHAASIAKKNAASVLSAASSEKNAAATAVETFTTNLDTASKERDTLATSRLTAAKQQLSKAIKALTGSMLANPYVLAAAAVVALGYGIYKLVTHQTEAEKAQRKLNEALGEAEKESLSEERTLARLNGELKAATKGTDEYNKIKNEIVKNYGKYY